MATYTDNYQLTKPTYAEQADIGVINSNMNKIDNIMHSSQISLADAYDSTQTYAEGDVVMYELLMYKCISPTTGVWDASKWERTTASESGGGGSAELDILGEGNGAVVSFADGASAELAKCIADIVPKQAGSGTPSPSNPRPITGFTAVMVDVAGKNFLDNTLCVERTINGIQRIVNNDGTITITGTSTVASQWWNSADNLGVFFKKGTYTISCNEVELRALFRKAQTVSGTFTLSEDDYLDNVFFITTVGETYDLITKPMIRLATESNTFEPYKGSTTTTPLGQTVYGGKLNAITGELTVTDGYITFDGTEAGVTWADIGNNMRSSILNIENLKSAPKATGANAEAIANYLEKVPKNYSADVTGFYFYDESNIYVKLPKSVLPSADTSGCTQYLQSHNLSICYKLLTPITVQLTPQEVNSLLGQNNISADTGDIDIVYVKASAPIQPNPTGTPTATLKKLGIEGTVFEVPSGGGGSSGEIHYSTTEQVIGTAEDENGIIKPLYEKMTYISSLSGTGETEYSLGIINIKNVYYVECIAETSTIALPLFYNAGNDNGSKIQIFVSDKLSGKIKINKFNDNRSSFSGTVIIRYTKTTD